LAQMAASQNEVNASAGETYIEKYMYTFYSWHSFDVFFYLTCLSLSKVSILSTADTPLIYFSIAVESILTLDR
jgi:hypothetical protein